FDFNGNVLVRFSTAGTEFEAVTDFAAQFFNCLAARRGGNRQLANFATRVLKPPVIVPMVNDFLDAEPQEQLCSSLGTFVSEDPISIRTVSDAVSERVQISSRRDNCNKGYDVKREFDSHEVAP